MSAADIAKEKLTFPQQFAAGGVAGMTELLCLYPLDVLKTRAQVSTGASGSMVKAFSGMLRTEGFGVYRGIVPPLFVEAPKRALKFACNAQYQDLCVPRV